MLENHSQSCSLASGYLFIYITVNMYIYIYWTQTSVKSKVFYFYFLHLLIWMLSYMTFTLFNHWKIINVFSSLPLSFYVCWIVWTYLDGVTIQWTFPMWLREINYLAKCDLSNKIYLFIVAFIVKLKKYNKLFIINL